MRFPQPVARLLVHARLDALDQAYQVLIGVARQRLPALMEWA
jgi:hypothetical protein